MTVFRTATLRTFFFAIHAGAKELNLNWLSSLANNKLTKFYSFSLLSKWDINSAGHLKFTLNSTTAKLQEVFRNRKSESLEKVCGNFSHLSNR